MRTGRGAGSRGGGGKGSALFDGLGQASGHEGDRGPGDVRLAVLDQPLVVAPRRDSMPTSPQAHHYEQEEKHLLSLFFMV